MRKKFVVASIHFDIIEIISLQIYSSDQARKVSGDV